MDFNPSVRIIEIKLLRKHDLPIYIYYAKTDKPEVDIYAVDIK